MHSTIIEASAVSSQLFIVSLFTANTDLTKICKKIVDRSEGKTLKNIKINEELSTSMVVLKRTKVLNL